MLEDVTAVNNYRAGEMMNLYSLLDSFCMAF